MKNISTLIINKIDEINTISTIRFNEYSNCTKAFITGNKCYEVENPKEHQIKDDGWFYLDNNRIKAFFLTPIMYCTRGKVHYTDKKLLQFYDNSIHTRTIYNDGCLKVIWCITNFRNHEIYDNWGIQYDEEIYFIVNNKVKLIVNPIVRGFKKEIKDFFETIIN